MEKVYYTCFKTLLGDMWAARTEKGLIQFNLPCSEEIFRERLKSRIKGEYINEPEMFRNLEVKMDRYLIGERVTWDTVFDLRGTSFQLGVWKAISEIPYGRLSSYSHLAEKAGSPKAVRAAGTATGANPLGLIIPCHRVIRYDGSLGGFSSGLQMKIELLKLEGIPVEERTKKELVSLFT
jgi:O-6-methylguanine DNA methyltransferase